MSIYTPTIVDSALYPIAVINPFAVNYYVAEGDPAIELVEAPTGVGEAIYVTHVSMSLYTILGGDVKITLQDEDGLVLFGPIQMQENGSSVFQKDWDNPMKVPDNKALDVFGNVGQVAFWIYVEGFIGDKPIV